MALENKILKWHSGNGSTGQVAGGQVTPLCAAVRPLRSSTRCSSGGTWADRSTTWGRWALVHSIRNPEKKKRAGSGEPPLKCKHSVKVRLRLGQWLKGPLFPAAVVQTSTKTQAQGWISRTSATKKDLNAKPWQIFYDKIWSWGYLDGWARNVKPQDSPECSRLGGAAPPIPCLRTAVPSCETVQVPEKITLVRPAPAPTPAPNQSSGSGHSSSVWVRSGPGRRGHTQELQDLLCVLAGSGGTLGEQASRVPDQGAGPMAKQQEQEGSSWIRGIRFSAQW